MHDAEDDTLADRTRDPVSARELQMEIHCIEALMDWLKPSSTALDVLNVYRLDEVLRRKRRALRQVLRRHDSAWVADGRPACVVDEGRDARAGQ